MYFNRIRTFKNHKNVEVDVEQYFTPFLEEHKRSKEAQKQKHLSLDWNSDILLKTCRQKSYLSCWYQMFWKPTTLSVHDHDNISKIHQMIVHLFHQCHQYQWFSKIKITRFFSLSIDTKMTKDRKNGGPASTSSFYKIIPHWNYSLAEHWISSC